MTRVCLAGWPNAKVFDYRIVIGILCDVLLIVAVEMSRRNIVFELCMVAVNARQGVCDGCLWMDVKLSDATSTSTPYHGNS